MQTANGRTSITGNLEEVHCMKHQDVQLASHADKELALDFRPWMNRAPLTVRYYPFCNLNYRVIPAV
jgi:hypothetical protein